MDDVESPDVFDALHNLSDDDAGLLLADLTTSFQKDTQIVAVCVFLHHVDVRACFNSLMEANSMGTAHHAMYFDLLMDAVQVLLRDVGNFDNLARVNLLRRVHRGAHGLLLLARHLLEQVGRELRFADLTVLAHSQHIVHENDEVIDFTHLRLLSGGLTTVTPRILTVLAGCGSLVLDRESLCAP